MHKIVVAPDSYKGSLTASAVASAMAVGIRRSIPDASVLEFPMADGGEGTLDALLRACAGREHYASVADVLLQERRQTRYALLEDHGRRTLVIEVAEVVGLPHAKGTVDQRSSQGVGELIRHGLDNGIRRFMVGLGGSSTNDGGAGVLAALGVCLLDAGGQPVPATLSGLRRLAQLNFDALDSRVMFADITLLADVSNPLLGPQGATAVFGRQKGVAPELVECYDSWIANLASLADRWAGATVSAAAGAGAAGGIGYALQLLGARFESGARKICDLQDIDKAIRSADWVLTGEGRSDCQTLLGKMPHEIARRSRAAGKPVSLLSGALRSADLFELGAHFDGCFSIVPGPSSLQQAMTEAERMIVDAAEQMTRLRLAVRG